MVADCDSQVASYISGTVAPIYAKLCTHTPWVPNHNPQRCDRQGDFCIKTFFLDTAPTDCALKSRKSVHSISIASKRKGSFRFFILLPHWLQLASKFCGSAPLWIKCLNSSTQSAISMKLCRYIPTRLRKKWHFKSASWWRSTGQFLFLPSTAAISVKLCMQTA